MIILFALFAIFHNTTNTYANWHFAIDEDEFGGEGACFASPMKLPNDGFAIMKERNGKAYVTFDYPQLKELGKGIRFEISIDNRKPYVFFLGTDEYFGMHMTGDFPTHIFKELSNGRRARIIADGAEIEAISLNGSAGALAKALAC